MTRTKKLVRTICCALSVLLVLPPPASAVDPLNYAKMGTELWKTLASRQSSGLSPELLPYHIFTDGENLVIIPQAFVAGFRTRESNPIKLVVPGQKTSEESDKYRVLPLGDFLKKNQANIHMVTAKNPPQPNMLNIYASPDGVPTTRGNISQE
jgi:hypothetical protein